MKTVKCGSGRRENDNMLPLSQHWNELLQAWDVDRIKSEQRFDEVRKAYAGPGRFYHTLDHVASVLEAVENFSRGARQADDLTLLLVRYRSADITSITDTDLRRPTSANAGA